MCQIRALRSFSLHKQAGQTVTLPIIHATCRESQIPESLAIPSTVLLFQNQYPILVLNIMMQVSVQLELHLSNLALDRAL